MAAGIAGRRAQVRVPGTAVAVTGEACANTGDNKTYRVTNALRRMLDPFVPVVVKVAGVTTGETYTLNRLSGTVTFATVNSGRGAVTIDGSYLPMASAARANRYSYTLSTSAADDTDFDSATADNGFTRKIMSLSEVEATIGGKWSVDVTLRDALINSTLLVVEFFPDRTQTRTLAFWASVDKHQLNTAIDSIQEYEVTAKGFADSDGRVASQ